MEEELSIAVALDFTLWMSFKDVGSLWNSFHSCEGLLEHLIV